MKKKLLSLAVLLGICTTFPIHAENEKPFVIPEVREWNGGEGEFTITKKSRILFSETNIQNVAEALAEDYREMFGSKLKVIYSATEKEPKIGDIVLKLQKDEKLGEEGYKLNITSHITLSAQNEVGVYWGTRTMLQIWEQNEGLRIPQGNIVDYPDYAMRGFMIDCGRKFIPLEYLRRYAKIMSYYKMNTFQIHLNDNGFPKYFNHDWNETYAAFRMESELFPELTAKDGHYGKAEFRDFQKDAAKDYVNIIPEIDVPAHSLAFTHFRPSLGTKEFGVDHLDLTNPEVIPFLDSLFSEYLSGEDPVFVGKQVHIGTDEYSNRKKEIVEIFRSFTDHFIREVEKYGKQAVVWGSLTHAKGETPVKVNNVLMSAWSNGFANPDSMMKLGYKMINISDGYTYIVPAAGYYYDYLNTQYLYEHWAPHNINGIVFDEKHPGIIGGMYAVWNDVCGNGISVKDIHHRAYPALQTIAAKTWGGKSGATLPYATFNTKRILLSEAPGVNEMGIIKGEPNSTVYSEPEVKAEKEYAHEEIGYNYSVTFDIEYKNETDGTILFESENAKFYLADPISGMLGYSRDGYLNTFKYSVRPGKKETLRIEGDNKAVRLFVNGVLFQELGYETRIAADKQPWKFVRTLVFPLRKSGKFNSIIKNLKVDNYCISTQK